MNENNELYDADELMNDEDTVDNTSPYLSGLMRLLYFMAVQNDVVGMEVQKHVSSLLDLPILI